MSGLNFGAGGGLQKDEGNKDEGRERSAGEKLHDSTKDNNKPKSPEPVVGESGSTTVEGATTTAEDAGVDPLKVRDGAAAELAAMHAANHGGATDDEGFTTFTSHPVQRFGVGRFQFVDGLLKLKGKDLTEFEDLVKTLPVADARIVAKLDTSKVDEIVKTRMAAATQQFDSSVGKDALMELQKQFPRVGTEQIGGQRTAHVSQSQTDENKEIPANPDGTIGEVQDAADAQQ